MLLAVFAARECEIHLHGRKSVHFENDLRKFCTFTTFFHPVPLVGCRVLLLPEPKLTRLLLM